LRGVERRTKGFQQSVDFSVEFADFAYYGADELSLVGRELRKCLGSLCMLHLELHVRQWKQSHSANRDTPICCRHLHTLLC
jgi:hypothetical protein